MKKILLTITAIASLVSGAMSQVSMDMETWVADPAGSLQDPQGWASFNPASAALMAQTVFKETTAPYAGLASAKIVTQKTTSFVMVPNPFRPGMNFDTVGIMGIGTVAGTALKFGAPTSGRPAVLSFASKYTPMAGDSAFVVVYLSHYNGASRDTIATGIYSDGATSTSYAIHNLTLNYDPAFSTVWADTEMVFASSSIYKHVGPKMGSTFYVDNFAFSGYNSVNDIASEAGTVSYYPNPATNSITFSSTVNAIAVSVMDITGREVGSYSMTGNKTTIETATFTPGIYVYNVMNDKKLIINRGKFEVVK